MLRSRATILGLALLVAGATIAAAHEKGVLKLARREFPAGDTLRLAGEKFSRNGRLTLSLVGTGGRTVLGDVQTDGGGAFGAGLLVPGNVTPGPYRLVAVAEDGDEVAGLDVAVTAPAAAETSVSHAGMAHETGAGEMTPSAQPLQLKRARSGAVTGSAIAGIVFALALAGVLLRNSKPAE